MMMQKQFYKAFSLLYEEIKDEISIYQKEEFYRLLFFPVYALINDGMYDNDSIRKITSGNQTIHLRVVKKLHTIEGFECFRSQVENAYVCKLKEPKKIIQKLLSVCEETKSIPQQIYIKLKESSNNSDSYQISRSISAILVCLNYADYQASRRNTAVWDTGFMRLEYTQPLPRYPRLISDIPHSMSVELIGRADEMKTVYQEVVENKQKLIITGVGGLGKTSLIQQFLNRLLETEVSVCGVEQIAWIPYDNQNLCVSMQQSLRLRCKPDEVWQVVQDMCAEQRERLLLIVDNIESKNDDAYLKNLADLPCRILVTSRYKELTGFHRQIELKPLSLSECRELFYKHYQFTERDNETLNIVIDLTARLTIMIVFLAKVAYLEGYSLSELYTKLVESGFKLSEEDVACEHERMQNDETIIRQMCILFSLVKYNDAQKMLLTNIALIPNLQFDFPKAKKWFQVQRNSISVGVLELGLVYSKISYNGQTMEVATADLVFGENIPEGKELAVIYAPNTGKASLRKSAFDNATVLKTCKAGVIVSVIEVGKTYTKVNYKGTIGYVKNSSLQFYSAAQQDTATGKLSYKGKTNGATTVNVRCKADKESAVVATWETGTAVRILSTANGWYEIEAKGIHGWVLQEYLTKD